MLNLDLVTIIFQVVNFVVLVVLLNHFLFRPLLRRAAQRAAEKERTLQELTEERQNVASLRAELEQRLSQVEEEGRKIIVQAQEQAESERQELLKRARSEVEQILLEAHADAYRVRQQAMREFHEQLLDAILEISGSVISRVVPPEVHDALVTQLSERIWEMGRTEMQRVEAFRRSLGAREPVAYITSARELSTEQRGQMARTLTALADRHVNMELKTDPELVAGVRVRLGDMLIDNSIAGQLSELRAQVSAALEERISSAESRP